MRRTISYFLWVLVWCGWAAQAGRGASNVIISSRLDDDSGIGMVDGALEALVACPAGSTLGAPAVGQSVTPGASWPGGGVVVATWAVDSTRSGQLGGSVQVVTFDYAHMGIAGLSAGQNLTLFWFPSATLASPVLTVGMAYNFWSNSAVGVHATMPWVTPDDTTGATGEIGAVSQYENGDVPGPSLLATKHVTYPVPAITSPSTMAATVGTTFAGYTIVGTNVSTTYTASGLPPGLSLNSTTGVISGTPSVPGIFITTVGARNSTGLSTAPVTFTVANNGPFTVVLSTTGAPAIYTSNYNPNGNAINLQLGQAPTMGATIPVLAVTGQSLIQGTFSNLAQGQTVSLTYNGATYQYIANYYGGSGNDLVLQWANDYLTGWGDSGYGALDVNWFDYSTYAVFPVSYSGALSGETVVALATGGTHSLALCADGTLASWGGNDQLVLGNGVAQVWGSNGYGELGNDSTAASATPVSVDQSGVLAGKTIAAVAAGQEFSVALCSDGTVATWGRGDSGQLGNGSGGSSSPVLVDMTGALAGKTVALIAAGSSHVLAMCSDGTLVTWGFNGDGELGNGSNNNSSVPVLVSATGVLAGKTVVAIAAGGWHNLVLCSDGTIVAWGMNGNGQLGDGTTSNRATPVVVTDPAGLVTGKQIAAVSAGQFHSLALLANGTIAAWGENSFGELGNGTGSDSAVPVAVNETGVLTGKSVVQVVAGEEHSLALCSDGSIAGWGRNDSNELSDGTTNNRSLPVKVDQSNTVRSTDRTVRLVGGPAAMHTLAFVASPEIAAPAISSGPSDATVLAGGTAMFTVTASGNPAISYQWTFGSAPISGATSSTLVLTNVPSNAAGLYTVTVTNSQGSASASANLTVTQTPPTFTSSPSSAIAVQGQPVTFTATVSGPGPLTYQWSEFGTNLTDGNGISGSTTPSLTISNVQTGNVGTYTLTVTNAGGSIFVDVTLGVVSGVSTTQALVGLGYVAGQNVTITNTVAYSASTSDVQWSVLLPTGWTFVSESGSTGNLSPPSVGQTGELGWEWSIVPSSPFTFSYTVNVPAGTSGAQSISSLVQFQTINGNFSSLGEPDPLVINLLPQFHSADENQDGKISLLELTRVIELYNTHNGSSRTGAYTTQLGTEDGFAPDPTRTAAQTVTLNYYHSADENQDGKLSLLELTRVIELYNYHSGSSRTGQYHAEAGTEDGFAPGP